VELDPTENVFANVTMIGDDRKGVVARVTQRLFELEANIETLEEHVQRGRFHMTLLAAWPRELLDRDDRERVRTDLGEMGDRLGLETRVDFHRVSREPRMAVLVTKEPHCLEAILEAREAGELPTDPVVVVGNHDNHLRGIAEDADVDFHHVCWDDKAEAETQLLALLDEYDIDLVVLARFMQILSPALCYRFRNRIINIHPSLLPAFPGADPYKQAYQHGVRVVGVTSHFVTPDLDEGPIIAQDGFRVGWEDDLRHIRKRGRELEGQVLVEAIETYEERDLDLHWGRVWHA